MIQCFYASQENGSMCTSVWLAISLLVVCVVCSEPVVRSGFQSLQLVIADFLPAIPHAYVSVCVDMSGQYGLQTVNINISLTSIGLLVRGIGGVVTQHTSYITTFSYYCVCILAVCMLCETSTSPLMEYSDILCIARHDL